jgi:hypothetical protein
VYWVREIAGWLLVLAGLLCFFVVYDLIETPPPPGETRPYVGQIVMAIVGIFVFRGGIHLLKVAMAARVCARADERLYPAAPSGEGPRPTAARRAVRPASRGANL